MPKSKSIKKVVLAYSGGLDTSVIVPWLKENYGCEVVCFAANVGPGRGAGRAGGQGHRQRRQPAHHPRPARRAGRRLHLPHAARRGGLRAQVPARHLHRPPADRQAPGRGGSRGRGGRRGPRRDRQGQRSGALRADLYRPRPAAEGHRPLARVGHPLARRRHRLCQGAQRAGQGHAEIHLQPGRQPVAPFARGRPAGRPLAGAGRGHVPDLRLRPRMPRTSRPTSRSSSSTARPWRSTGRSSPRPS